MENYTRMLEPQPDISEYIKFFNSLYCLLIRYACLVAEAAADEHSSSWELQKEIVGVVDVTVQRDDDVLSHIRGEGEYLYVSGIAVLTKFR